MGEDSEFGGEGIGCDGGVVAIVELYRSEEVKYGMQRMKEEGEGVIRNNPNNQHIRRRSHTTKRKERVLVFAP